MNKENLQRMADYVRTIPQEYFDMSIIRVTDNDCNTIGCIIGHCVNLDRHNVIANFLDPSGRVNYRRWINYFTGLNSSSDQSTIDYLFGGLWEKTDNTPTGAADRIEYVIKNGVPATWNEEMRGKHPLSYKK